MLVISGRPAAVPQRKETATLLEAHHSTTARYPAAGTASTVALLKRAVQRKFGTNLAESTGLDSQM